LFPAEPATHFSYPDDGGRFTGAASRCVGVGKCRGHSGGVMCPSYRVTMEEEHSTRGRARLLAEMIRGDVISNGWRSTEVRDALDLCLACKGCRKDCPVDVDMATYKAEFLSHHYARRLRPPAHYSMGWLPLWARMAAVAPRLVNAAARAPGLRELMKAVGGIAKERDLPSFAAQRVTDWYARRGARPIGHRRGGGDMGRGQDTPHASEGARVILWPDTFTNNFHPEVAKAAVSVLEDAGLTVDVPPARGTAGPLCCGLTWISTGQLTTAKRVLGRTVSMLARRLQAGERVVVLEPSCAAVFRSDAPELLATPDARLLAERTVTLAELLLEAGWQPPGEPVIGRRRKAIAQVHCHQHAIMGFDADKQLLARCGVDVRVLDSGCCGLAGNFGFERGHYEVSAACAERGLWPAVREADPQTAILADGFSCRTQIAAARRAPESTTRRAQRSRYGIHLAQLLADIAGFGAVSQDAAGQDAAGREAVRFARRR
ncbi:MAG: (Fe-S)-binding protein, partial [Micromonosporaceae bacterium]